MNKYKNQQKALAEEEFKKNDNYCKYCKHGRNLHYRIIECRCICNPCHVDDCDCNMFTNKKDFNMKKLNLFDLYKEF